MGWYGGYATKKELIDKLNRTERDEDRVWRTLKSKCVKEGGTTVLWQLNEIEALRDLANGMKAGDRKRFIQCALLERVAGEWMYKSMDEASGPHYYSCPKGYLEEAPCPNAYGAKWREGVKAYSKAA